jgi:hypothetical protein
MPREYSNVFACPFEMGRLNMPSDDPWEHTVSDGGASKNCVLSDASIRILPMDRTRNKAPLWRNDVHFHPVLKVPGSESRGAVCLLEGKAREGIAVALSPEAAFRKGETYEIYFGDKGNTHTTLRKGDKEVSFPMSGVCQERAWTSYWVCLTQQGKLYAGIGQTPGKRCVAIFDDSTPEQDTSIPYYVGLGNTGTGDRQPAAALVVRNVRLAILPEDTATLLSTVTVDTLEQVNIEDQQVMLDYQEQCRKARLRAAKFGTEYVPPPPDALMPWSDARRLKANPSAGFATGLDLQDPAEKSKQEARRKRFGIQQPSTDAADAPAEDAAESSIPVEQAWDKEDVVRVLRKDPPSYLWDIPPSDAMDDVAEESPPTFCPEKLHMFSIDWAAFKQIRTDDIMAYFSSYGPSYVEWLGDLSANVIFEDQFSAKRALEHLSSPLPSPPPPNKDGTDPLPDFGNMGWRLGKTMLRKKANDRYGKRGTVARILLRVSTSLDMLEKRPSSWLKPPAGFTTKRVLGPHSDEQHNKRQRSDHPPMNEGELLDRGLSSGRKGFSVEELQAERESKRVKPNEEQAEQT